MPVLPKQRAAASLQPPSKFRNVHCLSYRWPPAGAVAVALISQHPPRTTSVPSKSRNSGLRGSASLAKRTTPPPPSPNASRAPAARIATANRTSASSGAARQFHLDRWPLDRPRRARQRQQGSDRAASGPEISARRSLAHRTLDAAGILRLARPMALAHIRNRRRHPHPRARPIPCARRLRALLHIANQRLRIRAAQRRSLRLHRPRHRMVPPPNARRSTRRASRARIPSRPRLGSHRRRRPRRRLRAVRCISVSTGIPACAASKNTSRDANTWLDHDCVLLHFGFAFRAAALRPASLKSPFGSTGIPACANATTRYSPRCLVATRSRSFALAVSPSRGTARRARTPHKHTRAIECPRS